MRTHCARPPYEPSPAHKRMFFWLVGFGAVGGSALGGLAHHRRPQHHPSLWQSCAIGGLAGAGCVIMPLGLLSVLDGGFWGAFPCLLHPPRPRSAFGPSRKDGTMPLPYPATEWDGLLFFQTTTTIQ
ncbi:hypothetical protein pclt_cds_702b [Pandoravirus celtis]|uniref:Uncharacterized protein n=1 Tax=Pandoravirus celtis TaxID=2568002 RepID=A0A4D6EJC2_9VIRU|nr:hypothetical protein pclt_cds_702b [Pandoravirus celtis]